MIRAVIFDLDGTIGDTLPLCIRAFRCAIEPLAGRPVSDQEIIATFGPTEEGTIMALVPENYGMALDDYLKYYSQFHEEYPEPFPGIREVIEYLRSRNIIVGMVTGKGRASCDITLKKYGMEHFFDHIETGSPEGPCKPAGISAVMEKFVIHPSECIYVGDSPSDIISSREVGIQVVAAAWAATADKKLLESMSPDYLITSMKEFYEMLTLTLGLA